MLTIVTTLLAAPANLEYIRDTSENSSFLLQSVFFAKRFQLKEDRTLQPIESLTWNVGPWQAA